MKLWKWNCLGPIAVSQGEGSKHIECLSHPRRDANQECEWGACGATRPKPAANLVTHNRFELLAEELAGNTSPLPAASSQVEAQGPSACETVQQSRASPHILKTTLFARTGQSRRPGFASLKTCQCVSFITHLSFPVVKFGLPLGVGDPMTCAQANQAGGGGFFPPTSIVGVAWQLLVALGGLLMCVGSPRPEILTPCNLISAQSRSKCLPLIAPIFFKLSIRTRCL